MFALRIFQSIAIALLLAISGCNFSSEAVNNATGASLAPVVSAGTDRTAIENTDIQLSGAFTGGEGSVSIVWTQVSGATITIDSETMLNARFRAPNIPVGATEALVLRLTATDSRGRVGNDEIAINISEMPPTADAGPDRESFELAPVELRGTAGGSDEPLESLWTQVSGAPVAISDANMPAARFTAPDVPLNQSEVLVFRFTVTDAEGRQANDDIQITVSEQPTTVSISGTANYEMPAVNPSCAGLDFSNIAIRPIRQATVQLIDANSGTVLAATTTDDSGNYSFISGSQTSVFIRVRAELNALSGPTWDVDIRDNTSSTVLSLGQRPLYVLDGPPSSPSGANEVRDMVATTGWSGLGFTGVRAAAPFSILDSVYSSMLFVRSADSTASFAPLDIFWSVNNTNAAGDIDIGEIGTSFYRPDINALFLLGQQGVDIDEFDHHVVTHEWAHFFEDNFSRTDNIGGSHGPNDKLDARVAFSEGLATAFAGMALDNPQYCDSLWSQGVISGFGIDIENESTGADAGWYNEASVMKVLFDLWDTTDDGVDNSSIGFVPMYSALTGANATSESSTSIFSFVEALRGSITAERPFLDALLDAEGITSAGIDEWGATEINDGGSTDSLPVYKILRDDGTTLTVCSNNEFDSVGLLVVGNRLNVHQLLRLDVTTSQRYRISMQADAATLALLPPDDPMNSVDQSDPDISLFQRGQLINEINNGMVDGQSRDANSEALAPSTALDVGTYVVDVVDFRHEDPNSDEMYPGRTCFDISVVAIP